MTTSDANNETNRRLDSLEAGQKETNRRLDSLEAGQKETNRRLDSLEAGQKETNRRLDSLEAGQKETNRRLDSLEAGQEELRAGQRGLEGRMDRVERAVQSLRDDIGPLKAAHARDSALRVSYRICEDLGLDEVRLLDRDERRAMVRQADTSGIPSNYRHSFIEADAIIEAVDEAGATHYVAMEASFTADERDTTRAVRNAGYLTRFTGRPGHAVVAANRIDNRVAGVIASGKVRWCRLDEEDLQID